MTEVVGRFLEDRLGATPQRASVTFLGVEPIDPETVADELLSYADRVRPMVIDDSFVLNDALDAMLTSSHGAVVVTGGRGEYRGVASFQQVMEHIRQVQEQAAALSERVDGEADASSTVVASFGGQTSGATVAVGAVAAGRVAQRRAVPAPETLPLPLARLTWLRATRRTTG